MLARCSKGQGSLKDGGSIRIINPNCQCVPLQGQQSYKAFLTATAVARDITNTLLKFIRRKVIHVSVSMKYADINIKSTRA